MSATAAGVIPARYGSRRLPGKLLLDRTGKPLLQYAWEAACKARLLDPVMVATDDHRIADVAEGFGAEVIMTSDDHPSGSDRVAEVMARVPHDRVVNVQGDEPEVDPEDLDRLAECLATNRFDMVTLVRPLEEPGDEAIWQDENAVKAVMGEELRVLYFSRLPVPFGGFPGNAYLHLGVYAWRTDRLIDFASTLPVELEEAERLEQLRALALGMRVGALLTFNPGVGIDTAADYARFVERMRARQPGGTP